MTTPLNVLNVLCLGLHVCMGEGHPVAPPTAVDLQHCQRRTPDCLRYSEPLQHHRDFE
jgi:hypothetical protein